MLIDFLQGGIEPLAFLKDFVTFLPAILIALTLHEFGHAFVAYKCGDPTAYQMGRMSVNPLRHLDLRGLLFMLLVGVGWAKPVPVNPRNFKNPRRDDLLVSIAGITMNLIQMLFCLTVMYFMIGLALQRVPAAVYNVGGTFNALIGFEWYTLDAKTAFLLAPWIDPYLITPHLGTIWGYVYRFLSDLALINLSLAIFNLLPVPPLDGYHLFNDLFFKRPLFASARAQQIGYGVVLLLLFTGLFSKAMSFVQNGVLTGLGNAAFALFSGL